MTTIPEREPIDISDLAARAAGTEAAPSSGPRTSGPQQWRETGQAWTPEAADEFERVMAGLLDGAEVDA